MFDAFSTKLMPLIVLQIGESFKRFGVNDETTSLLVAKFDATPEEVSSRDMPCPILTQVHLHTQAHKCSPINSSLITAYFLSTPLPFTFLNPSPPTPT